VGRRRGRGMTAKENERTFFCFFLTPRAFWGEGNVLYHDCAKCLQNHVFVRIHPVVQLKLVNFIICNLLLSRGKNK
jgi:hypothetical protein